jgi:hypothetical protein
MPAILNANNIGINKDGLQLVGLSKWSHTGTDNCANAVKASACRNFEFSYCPFFNLVAPFRNANVLNSIPGIAVTETIFLGWRQESAMQGDWNTTLATLRNRASQVNIHANEIRGRVAKIVLIPVLEDYWSSDQWLQAVKVIASQLDSGTEISFRRSGMLNAYEPPLNIMATLKGGKSYVFTDTLMEVHKIDFSGKGQVVSNDGGFVFQPTEILGLHEDASSFSEHRSGCATLDDWSASAKASTKTAMLWRPAYNLFPRTIENGRISYKLSDVTLDNRVDNDANPFFSKFEAALVEKFLAGKK